MPTRPARAAQPTGIIVHNHKRPPSIDTAMHILDTGLAQEIVARTMRIIPFNQH